MMGSGTGRFTFSVAGAMPLLYGERRTEKLFLEMFFNETILSSICSISELKTTINVRIETLVRLRITLCASGAARIQALRVFKS